MRIHQRYSLLIVAIFLGGILLYGSGVLLAELSGSVVVQYFPENYAWQIKSAMHSGDYKRAEAIASKRMAAEHYDFEAHRLLAYVYLNTDRAQEAIDLLLESLNRMRNAENRPVYTVGLNPVETYELLYKSLTANKQDAFAHEVKLLADDYRWLSSIGYARGIRANGINRQCTTSVSAETIVPFNSFTLSSGVSRSSSGTLIFTHNSTAIADIKATAPLTELALQISGKRALGLGPILRVQLSDREVIQAYAGEETPRWVCVPLNNWSPGTTLRLTLEFLNDGFDPITQADRNLEVLQVAVH